MILKNVSAFIYHFYEAKFKYNIHVQESDLMLYVIPLFTNVSGQASTYRKRFGLVANSVRKWKYDSGTAAHVQCVKKNVSQKKIKA